MTADLYQTLLDNLYDAVYYVDRDRVISYWNKAAEDLTGYGAGDVLGSPCYCNILRHVDDEGHELCKGMCPLAQTLIDGKRREASLYFHHKDGHRVPIAVRIAPIRDGEGTIIGGVEVFSDASRQRADKSRIEDLQRLALIDELTELPNRRYLRSRLEVAIDELTRYGWQTGVLMIDIDHFKQVNDRYGHAIGDQVLQMVSRTLGCYLRRADTVGRWGGEEFLALLSSAHEGIAYEVARRVCMLVQYSSLDSVDPPVEVTVSIGATITRAEDTAQSILERVDALLYHAKRTGRNRVAMHTDE